MERKDPNIEEIPERYGDYEYYSKRFFNGDLDYDVLYRRKIKGMTSYFSKEYEKVLDLLEIPFVKKYFYIFFYILFFSSCSYCILIYIFKI
jgi:hypothetical protein